MQLVPSTNSIVRQGTVSGGQLPIDFESIWNLLDWNDIHPFDEGNYVYIYSPTGGDDLDDWELAMRGRGPRVEAALRFLGHAMIQRIPLAGLAETLDTLYGLYEYYSVEPVKVLPDANARDITAVVARL